MSVGGSPTPQTAPRNSRGGKGNHKEKMREHPVVLASLDPVKKDATHGGEEAEARRQKGTVPEGVVVDEGEQKEGQVEETVQSLEDSHD